MALTRKLKDGMMFNEGARYLGDFVSATLPKLGRKFEEYQGGGMDAPVKIDMGGQPLEMEFTCGGPMRDVILQHGATGLAAVGLRFAGAWQNDATGQVDQIEVSVRGRHEEIDMGEAKVGEGGEFKVKSALVYYRLDWNSETLVEIDILNGIYRIGGVDRNAEIRALIG